MAYVREDVIGLIQNFISFYPLIKESYQKS